MDLDVLSNLNWRVALVAIIVLLAVYVVVVSLRIHRLRREKEAAAAPDPLAAQSAVAAYAAEQHGELAAVPVAPAVAAPEPAVPAFPWNEPPPEIPGQRRIEALERELVLLRREVDAVRSEVLILREQQRRELTQAQVAQNVSPLYNDAMQMARQGHDAATISQHCGIARAEAELVVSLARNRDLQ